METAVVIGIICAAAAYLGVRVVRMRRAIKSGKVGCDCCSDKGLCSKTIKPKQSVCGCDK